MSITLDTPYVITETKPYTSFIIVQISIVFSESAKVSIQLSQDGLETLNKIIEVPIELYTNWSFNETQITDYIKAQLLLP